MPEVPICTGNAAIPALGVRSLFEGERMKFQLEYLFQHLLVCMSLLIQPLLRNIAVRASNGPASNHYNAVHWGHLTELGR
jgi:hypothetical protein